MTQGLQVPSHIFKSYDIRGVVDSEITESIAELIGAVGVTGDTSDNDAIAAEAGIVAAGFEALV